MLGTLVLASPMPTHLPLTSWPCGCRSNRMSHKKLESLLVEAFSDDAKIGAEFERLQLRAVQLRGPIRQPLGRLRRVFNRVPERGHQVRFALTATAEQHDRARLVRLRRLEHPQEVNGRISDAQELGGRFLRALVGLSAEKSMVVPFEAFALEFVA